MSCFASNKPYLKGERFWPGTNPDMFYILSDIGSVKHVGKIWPPTPPTHPPPIIHLSRIIRARNKTDKKRSWKRRVGGVPGSFAGRRANVCAVMDEALNGCDGQMRPGWDLQTRLSEQKDGRKGTLKRNKVEETETGAVDRISALMSGRKNSKDLRLEVKLHP